jgi:hypothetical protein
MQKGMLVPLRGTSIPFFLITFEKKWGKSILPLILQIPEWQGITPSKSAWTLSLQIYAVAMTLVLRRNHV